MLDRYLKSPSIRFFEEGLLKQKSFLIEGLWDTPKALLIALCHKVAKKNVLVLTGGIRENRLCTDFSFFGIEDPLEFPSWETLPEEGISPSSDIMGKRLEILQTLSNQKTPKIVITSIQGVLQKVLSKESLNSLFQIWKTKEEIPFDMLPSFLPSLGYKRSTIVSDKGEFALRGGILDIFPFSSLRPFRIEFFGDTIDNIRSFDAGTQKSIEKVSQVTLTPSEEFFLRKEGKNSLLLDYLGKDTVVFFDDLLALEDNLVSLQSLKGFSSSLVCPWKEHIEKIKTGTYSQIYCTHQPIESLSPIEKKKRDLYSEEISFSVFSEPFSALRWFHPFAKVEEMFPAPTLMQFLEKIPEFFSKTTSFIFISENEREEQSITENLSHFSIENPISMEKGYLSSSFSILDIPLVAISERTFSYHSFKVHRQKWRTQTQAPMSLFHTLSIGDPVVHIHSGIGKYLGIEKHLNHLGENTEFLAIEYAESSKLYIPLSQSHLISRYIGSREEIPTLSTLGSVKWQRTKAHAHTQIVGYAEELLRLYAERSLDRGFCYPTDSNELLQF
ncbi:MAG: CarD family transcriptional regulator [Chlamydiota bacterium]